MTLKFESTTRINTDLDLENKSAVVVTSDKPNGMTTLRNSQQKTETNDFSNLYSIDKSDISTITLKLRELGILGTDDTLEQWLSEISSQITDGSNLSIPELLTGLKQFSKLK